MKSPGEIKASLLKKWDNGSFYSAIFSGDIFPYSLSIKRLKDQDYRDNFKNTLSWLKSIDEYFDKPGIQVEKKKVKL